MPFDLSPPALIFLLLLTVGAFIQAITGFAMGLIAITGTVLFGLVDVRDAALALSMLSLVNVLTSLRRGGWRQVHRPMTGALVLGALPTMAIGVMLLDYLAQHWIDGLKLILGLFVLFGALSSAIQPRSRDQVHGTAVNVVTGACAGLFNGLFSAAGSVLAFHLYRQPLPLPVVRATLLGTFCSFTVLRTATAGLQGQMTLDALALVLAGIPLVMVASHYGSRWMHRLPDQTLRRLVMLLLFLAGLSLCVSGLLTLLRS